MDKSCLEYTVNCRKNSSMCIFYIYIGTTNNYKLSSVDYIISGNPTPLQDTLTGFIMEYGNKRNFLKISNIFNKKFEARFDYEYADALKFLVINGYYWI